MGAFDAKTFRRVGRQPVADATGEENTTLYNGLALHSYGALKSFLQYTCYFRRADSHKFSRLKQIHMPGHRFAYCV
jgi:hypothetical protein